MAEATTEPEWRIRLFEVLRRDSIAVTEDRPADFGQHLSVVGRAVGASGFAFMLVAALLRLVMPQSADWDYSDALRDLRRAQIFLVLSVAGLLLIPIAFVLGHHLKHRALRIQAANPFAELDRLPTRRPILFLRTFKRDSGSGFFQIMRAPGEAFEMTIVDVLRGLGPVIAIGKPGETLPPVGAARFYIPDTRWEDTVSDLAEVSQLIVLVYGSTRGLLWELRKIVERLDPEILLICIPKDDQSLAGRRYAWRQFRDSTRTVFPRPLQDDAGGALFLRFGPGWEPILVGPSSPVTPVGERVIRDYLQECLDRRTG